MSDPVTDLARIVVSNHEGRIAYAYDDKTGKAILPGSRVLGNPTIGDGIAIGKGVGQLTTGEMDYLRDNRIARATMDAASCMAPDVWAGLTTARKVALIDAAYALGRTKLALFKDMLAAIAAGDFDAAAKAMLASDWYLEEPGRVQGDARMLQMGTP